MKQKPTVTIGIPAHNEQYILPLLLKSLCEQSQTHITIEKILVISDGSTDHTVKNAKKVTDGRIQVIDSSDRLGKPSRINQMFKLLKSDFFVLIDADLFVHDKDMVYHLVRPMIENKDVDLTSGDCTPVKPVTFAEKISNTALEIWDQSKAITPHSEMYYCGGQLRAFRKRLCKVMVFPPFSADDVYAFLFCKQTGKQFQFEKDAQIFFKLPSTISDFIKQNKRFLRSKDIQDQNFDPAFVDQFYTIGIKEKLIVLIQYFLQHPFFTSCYLFFVVLLRVLLMFDKEGTEATWSIVTSTKQ